MTQATVNGGNSTVKNLNPDAQQFSSSDFNNGTVLAGSTAPSDDSYADYIDNGTASYLRQHQSHIYPIDPSSIDTLQQQQTESNFAIHEHGAMLDTVDHQQTSHLNPNHLHHPQSHMHQTMPNDEQAQQVQLTPEQLRQNLRKQLEYYFSRENMVHDTYLKSKMDADDYVPIHIIANFKLVKRLTHDLQLIIDVLKESSLVEVDNEEKKVRSSDKKTYLPTRKRCIIILRNVPLDATENEIFGLFLNEYCSASAIECERVLEADHSDCWYVTFNNEDDAQNAFLYLTRENVSIRGQKILARMKARLWQKPIVSSKDSFINPSIPQNSSSISIQEQYTPVYIQPISTNHTNQSSFLGNIPQTAMNYRHTQVLQHHLPINYNVPSTVSFARNPQQMNMNFPQQTQFINRNHSAFPLNFWYIPTTDTYPPTTYNGTNKSKTRLTTAKPRPTKPITNQEELPITNDPNISLQACSSELKQ